MMFQYYPDTDMLYIKFFDGISTESEEVQPGIVLDFDEDNRLLGIEVEDASNMTGLAQVALALTQHNLPLVTVPTEQKFPFGLLGTAQNHGLVLQTVEGQQFMLLSLDAENGKPLAV